MNDVLGYRGKIVVITGAASGMGKAAAQLLVDLGAEVYALDIAEVSVPVSKALKVDMKDSSSLASAIDELPQEVDALFNCAGVPSPPFSAEDTVLINFSGLRYLTEQLLPRIVDGGAIASIASTAGMGWQGNLKLVREFLDLENSIDAARSWLDGQAGAYGDGYGFSKQCIIVYTMSMARTLAARGIRINCISPSPTDSAFMQQLKADGQIPEEAIQLFLPSIGRYATGEEMGKALVMLNSQLACFVSGVNLPVDFGYCGEVWVGQRDDLLNLS